MISLIIPMYNEENNIDVLKAKLAVFFVEFKYPFEVIFVNDGSTDHTLSMLSNICEENFKIITYEQNKGKGYALKKGVKHAVGDYIFFTDADLAYGLEVLYQGMAIFEKSGCEIVIGSRHLDTTGYASYTIIRKIMSYVFSFIVGHYLRISLSDTQCGFKGFEKSAAKKLFSVCEINGFGIDFELLYMATKNHMKIEEMSARVIHHGESSVHPIKDSIKMLQEMKRVKQIHQ